MVLDLSTMVYNRELMRWAVPFAATLFAMFCLQMSSLGFSPLLPAIQKQFGATYSEIGLFTGLYGIIAIAMSYPAGALARRFGEKSVLTVGLLIVALGLAALSAAPNFPLALTARLAWLTGYRLAFVCVLTAIALTAPPSLRASSMGILGATAALASVIGAPFGSKIGAALGWRGGIAAYGIMALAGAAIFWMFYHARSKPDAFANPHEAPSRNERPIPAYRSGVAWALALLLGCANAGGFSATFFVPSALKTNFGLDAVGAAYVISTAYVFAILANLGCGYLIDRLGRWIVMGVILTVIIASALAMTSPSLLVFRVAVTLVIGLGLVCSNQVYGLGADVLRGRETGPVMGIVSLGAGVFGYVGPQLLGALRDWTGGFNAGWYAMAALAGVALGVIIGLSRSRFGCMQNIHQEKDKIFYKS
jgi:predicted MFS family arabinose efflux permease